MKYYNKRRQITCDTPWATHKSVIHFKNWCWNSRLFDTFNHEFYQRPFHINISSLEMRKDLSIKVYGWAVFIKDFLWAKMRLMFLQKKFEQLLHCVYARRLFVKQKMSKQCAWSKWHSNESCPISFENLVIEET